MSYVATTTVTPTNSSDAAFRLWGGAVSAKLASMGLVQTSDTGQINWTTVLAPTAISTVMGYEIWRFADALQATVPVFFKLEYGSGTATNNPSMHLTFGSGSNGSGTLTGVTTVRRQFTCSASGAITVYWCGDTNRFIFTFQGATLAAGLVISVERTVDTAGAVTNEGVLISGYSTSAWSQVAWNCVTGPYTVWETTTGAIGPSVAPFGTTGVQTAIYPNFFNKGVFLPYGYNWFGYFDGTITVNAIISITIYGVAHNYIAIGATAVASTLNRSSSTISAMLQRYD